MASKKQKQDITVPINKLIEEVNNCLNNNDEAKYFQNVALLYSFHENILKWLLFAQMVWDKSDNEIEAEEMKKMGDFCRQLTFFQAQNLALSIGLIDLALFKRIDAIRKKRNSILHDLWLFEHRNDFPKLKLELENLANVTNDIMQIFNDLTEEIGVDEVYTMML